MYPKDYILAEITNEQNYRKQIKDRCFMCLIWFKNSWNHYQTFGNTCATCSGRIIRVRFNSKQRTKTKLTPAESLFFLRQRRDWVLANSQNLKPSARPKRLICAPCPIEEFTDKEKELELPLKLVKVDPLHLELLGLVPKGYFGI